MHAQQELLDPLCTKHLQADLKGRSVRGGLFTISSQGTQFLMQSVQTVVLARLLTPADFGLVAMVTAVTGLAQGFADVGLSEATIQRQEIDHDQVSALFWINVAVGLGLMLATMALGPVLAWFYREPRLRTLRYSVLDFPHQARVQPMPFLRSNEIQSPMIRGHCGLDSRSGGSRQPFWAGILGVSCTAADVELTQITLSWVMVN